MKILAILGSARKNGNSETLVQAVIESLVKELDVEVDYLRLAGQKLSPCRACGGCEKTGLCVIQDDMGGLYERVDQADIIFLTSPIYFYGLSAQSKVFIDRIQARWSRKYLQKIRFRRDEKRKGYLISTAATRGKKLFDGAILVAKSFFDAIDVDYGGELVVRGVDDKEALKNNPEELERAKQFAEEISADFLK
ncbi:MAG: flavodoxin family protein [Deltaproteobacteria bacterium]|nr:flavodoxin family protein [Deltaproteobacteria bacterium]MBT8359340.1 flavodoxin family protein [Deltaproteobacteria bacterium]